MSDVGCRKNWSKPDHPSGTIWASAVPPLISRMATLGLMSNRAWPAAPGFTTSRPSALTTSGLCVWPNTMTCTRRRSAAASRCGAKARVGRIVGVAEHRVEGRDNRQLVEDLVATDITGMQDERDAGEHLVNFWSHQPMCVRNEADAMDGVCRRSDAGQLLTS